MPNGYIVDGVYDINVNPPVSVQGISTDVWGIVGTFQKGPVNVPTYIVGLDDLENEFGPADSTLTGYIGALSAATQGANQFQVVRVVGSGAVAASTTVNDSFGNPVFTSTYQSVGVGGNNASVQVSAATQPGAFKLVYTDGTNIESFDNVVTVLPATPTVAPTLTATGTTGTLPAGTYTVAWSGTNAFGETQISPTTTVTITAGQNIAVSAITLPATLTGVKYYMSVAVGSTSLAVTATGTGAATTLTALPPAGAEIPPVSNTAQTGFTLVTNISSQIVNNTQPATPNTNLPVSNFYALAGGNNGTVPPLSTYIGTQNPNTGMYALAGTSPAISQFFLAGQADADAGSVQTIGSFCSANSLMAAVCLPQGTTSANAIAATATLNTDRVALCWPWQQMFVSELNQTLIVPPTGYWVGRVSTLYPQESPGNKSLVYTSGTEFTVSSSDIAACLANRVVPVGVSIPRGGLGISSGATLSQTPSLNPVYRRRMNDFIVESINTALGAYVDEPITPTLLQDQQSTVSAFLNPLTTNNNESGKPMIASYSVQCNSKNNPVSITSTNTTIIDTLVQLFNMNRFILFRTQIAAGVITTTIKTA